MGIIKSNDEFNNGRAAEILEDVNAIKFLNDGSYMLTGKYGTFEEVLYANPDVEKELSADKTLYKYTEDLFVAAKDYHKEE